MVLLQLHLCHLWEKKNRKFWEGQMMISVVLMRLAETSSSSSSSWGATTSEKFWPSQWVSSIWSSFWCSPPVTNAHTKYLYSDEDGDECGSVLQQQAKQVAENQQNLATSSNPFLDVPNAATAIEYKKGYVMRKSCVDPNGKKSKLCD